MLQTVVIDTVYPVEQGAEGLLPALRTVCQEAAEAANTDCTLIVLSDRKSGEEYIPIR